jgi:hypothetical protein
MMAGSPMASSVEIQINLLGVRLRIAGPASVIGPLRDSLFSRCQEPVGAEPDAYVRVTVDERGYHVHHAEKAGEAIFESESESDFFWWLDDVLFSRSLKRSNHLIQIHGAAVEREGKAVIFCGDSYAGKSTMTFHLIRRGWRFFTDEVILLDPETMRVRPFHRNLLVRQGALENDSFLKEKCQGHWHYDDYNGETKWLIDPKVVGAASSSCEAEVERIFLLLRDKEAPHLIEPVGPRLVVEEMLKQSFNPHKFSNEIVNSLIGLAEECERHRIRAPHGGVAWGLLSAHMGLLEKE